MLSGGSAFLSFEYRVLSWMYYTVWFSRDMFALNYRCSICFQFVLLSDYKEVIAHLICYSSST